MTIAVVREYHRILIEPVGFVRIGGERLKLNFKLSTSYIPHLTNYPYRFTYIK